MVIMGRSQRNFMAWRSDCRVGWGWVLLLLESLIEAEMEGGIGSSRLGI